MSGETVAESRPRPHPRRHQPYLVLGIAIAVFVASLAAATWRLYTIESNVAHDFGENLAWSMSQNEVELLRLVDALRRRGDAEPGTPGDEVQQRLDVLWSRLNITREGEMGARIRETPGAAPAVERSLIALARLEPRIRAVPAGDAPWAREVAVEVAALLPDLHDASVAVAHAEIERLAERSDTRRGALLSVLVLLVALMASAGMLVAILIGELRRGRRLTAQAEAAEVGALASEQRFRDILAAASDWIWETDAEDRFVFLSGHLRELSGEDPARVLGRHRRELRLSEDGDDANWAWYESMVATRQPYRGFEFRYGDAAGKPRWARIHGRPIFDAQHRFVGYRGTGHDITAERAAAEEIAESRELLRAVIDAVPGIINVKDRDSRYVLMNRFQGEVYGVDPAAAVGKVSADFTGPEYGNRSREYDYEVVSTGRPQPFAEREFVNRDGSRRVWWTSKQPLRDAAGIVRHVVTVALDITGLKSAERARTNLARYFSPNMVDLLAGKDGPIGKVRRQDVAVVFTDLVDFTRIAARETPEHTMALLRELHGRLTDAVFVHSGTLEKFLGDGLMATFGTPSRSPRDAGNALECCVDMVHIIATWNEERAAAGEPPLAVGIGAHFGPVILGDIGTDQRVEYAVVGDTVNIASRLEELTRRLGSPVVVSRALIETARGEPAAPLAALDAFVLSPAQPIQGRDETIEVYALDLARLADAEAAAPPAAGNAP
ncbi:MAG TPA: PAS domain S-box protein [Stellaceae bacterium]|nr:PAS domain S-box protein [Stellaceae bacterium]